MARFYLPVTMPRLRQRLCLTQRATTACLTRTARTQLWTSNNQQFGLQRIGRPPEAPQTISLCKENGQLAKGRANRMVTQTTHGTGFQSKRNSDFRNPASRSVAYPQFLDLFLVVPRRTGRWSSNGIGFCGRVPRMMATLYSTVNILARRQYNPFSPYILDAF